MQRTVGRRAATLAFVVAASVVLAVGGRASATEPQTTFTIMTYNVAGVPEVFWKSDKFGPLDLEQRGELIAQHISAGDYDIVAIQEAFESEIRKALVDGLSGAYPYRVRNLHERILRSSGLMVFSKFPFAPFPKASSECYREWATEAGAGTMCEVAYHRFDHGFSWDALSDKGIGFVSIENPQTRTRTNLFLTHLQATYDEPARSRDARAGQIREIVAFMDTWAPIEATRAADTVLVGDLNIIAGSLEYRDRLRDGGLAGPRTQLTDAWRTTSPNDPGYTWSHLNSGHDGDDERLDYILIRRSTDPFCFQHIFMPRFFQAAAGRGVIDLSDHYPLVAVLGPPALHCSPSEAKPDFEDVGPFSLDHPNAYQWFRYSSGGTYSFRADPGDVGGVALMFFGAADLSKPLRPWEGSGILSDDSERTVVAPRGPFYVRVQALDRANTGSYVLSVERHGCLSFEDACQLDPSSRLSDQMQMTATATPAPAGRTYYMFRTNRLDSGRKQDIVLETLEHAGLLLKLQVYAATDTSAPIASTGPPGATYAQPEQELASLGFSYPSQGFISAASATYFLVVERDPSTFGTYSIRWTTNLAMLDLQKLRCIEQEDFFGDDSIDMRVNIDGSAFTVFLGAFDTDQAKGLDFYPHATNPRAIAFGRKVSVSLFENDDDPDDFLGRQEFLPRRDGGERAFTGDGAHYRLFFQSVKQIDD